MGLAYNIIRGNRDYCHRKLDDIPSKELEVLVRDILEKEKKKGFNYGSLLYMDPSSDVFLAAGAYDVLRDRGEEEIVFRLTGLRDPKTLGEKIKYFFTGKRPTYEPKIL